MAGTDDRARGPALSPAPGLALSRVPLLALGFVALVVGTGAGLARLGWSVPSVASSAAALHGPLMIGAFFGVLIALERAVAVGRPWTYAAPLLAGLGGIATIAGSVSIGGPLLLAGSLVLLAATIDIFRRQRALFTFVLVLGAACWPAGNALWLAGWAPSAIVVPWLAFLVLTIAAERLELSRFLPPSAMAKGVFVLILAAIAMAVGGARFAWSTVLFGAGLVALAAWLFKQDIARRTVSGRGLTRYIAVCLLSGYAWLAIGGGVMVGAEHWSPGTAAYGAAVHALGLGFVFSMVFGHAPIIFPAVLRVRIPYRPVFYAPLALLHASLAVRLAGDALADRDWTRWGAMMNAIALVAFIAVMLASAVRGRRAPATTG